MLLIEACAAAETGSTGGTFATTILFRFSAKYTEAETGLLYYGYRYYQPRTGCWLSRDPIGERGGRNLNSACRNSPVGFVDPFGLDVYVAYRPLAMGPLARLFPLAGHVYLAFNDEHMGADWLRVRRQLGYTRDGWHTFSYHPSSVSNGVENADNIVSVVATAGSWVDVDNNNADRVPITRGPARLILVTSDSCKQEKILRRAHESALVGGYDIGPYSFLVNNCASWTKKMVEQTGATYPAEAMYLTNLGTGVGGVTDQFHLPQAGYVGVMAGVTINNAVSLVINAVNNAVNQLIPPSPQPSPPAGNDPMPDGSVPIGSGLYYYSDSYFW